LPCLLFILLDALELKVTCECFPWNLFGLWAPWFATGERLIQQVEMLQLWLVKSKQGLA